MRNRIYFFTGTGNSLKVAEDIAKVLPNCELVAIHNDMDTEIPSDFQRIGFVFPVYFWGLPSMVADFFRNANFPKQGSTYFFAVATCRGIVGNAIRMTSTLLLEKGIHLSYSDGISMYGNAVTHYDMSKKVNKITEKSDKKILSIASNIENKKTKKIKPISKLIYGAYLKNMANIHTTANEFNANDNCISCGICKGVCPARNISLEAGRPVFHDQCESCLACIQHCPKRAINYKDKTQNRRRYTHPQVGHKKIMDYYK